MIYTCLFWLTLKNMIDIGIVSYWKKIEEILGPVVNNQNKILQNIFAKFISKYLANLVGKFLEGSKFN